MVRRIVKALAETTRAKAIVKIIRTNSFYVVKRKKEGKTYGCSSSSRALVCLRALGFLTSSPEVSAPPLSRLIGEETAMRR